MSSLRHAVEKVVANGNCTGCGGCALISSDIRMKLDSEGFLRPSFGSNEVAADGDLASLFQSMCPGLVVSERDDPELLVHPTFGKYVSAWEGWAEDKQVRQAGSSAGVLTALSSWLVESKQTRTVIGSAADSTKPGRTVAVEITSRDEALKSSGSRYAPVCNLPGLRPSQSENALVGKPCEVTAAKQLYDATGIAGDARPILLSFFCAGTPSQNATNELIERLGVQVDQVESLQYRGDGWPGRFRVQTSDAEERSMSYQDSWGKHLGRDLQWRCKLCVDGTGGHADISVGDYWNADENGFPLFEDSDGNSAVIARTYRGHELLMRAVADGIISLRQLDLHSVASVQPLQATRKRTLFGRLVGRRLAGKSVPNYVGYGLLGYAKGNVVDTLRAVLGTFRRTIAQRGPDK